jgi:enoyl-CoA hydratase/carnithine racemase
VLPTEEELVSDRILIELGDDGVADVRLNRPEKMNALDGAMFEALSDAGHQLAETPGLRAAVLSGEGRAFCAGLDFASFQATTEPGARPTRSLLDRPEGTPANFAQSAAWVWRELPVPVIAAVHGVAYGGGLQIALGADVRIVAPDSRLSVRELHWGLIPDMSATQTLRQLVRLDVARELTYTARIVSGEEAVELGLATRCDAAPREAAFALAREIARHSPDAVRGAKRLLSDAMLTSVEDGLALEEEIQRSLIGSPNQIEAVRANMEKRPPRFRDPD